MCSKIPQIGHANESECELRRLAFIFVHPDASKDQREVMRQCLGRPSLNILVEELLSGSDNEVKNGLPKQKKRTVSEEYLQSTSDLSLRLRPSSRTRFS